MSMPIQRQSESFGYFDDGPRFARDRSSTELPSGLAHLVNTSGPRITGGLLNTRQAVNVDGMNPDDHAYYTEAPHGPGGEWVGDEDGYRSPRRKWNPDYGYEPTDDDERRSEGVAEDDASGYNWGPEPRRASRRPFDRAAAERLAACLECGDDVLPRDGDWEHVEGPSDHPAEPDHHDYDNDEYGMGRDPARAMDEFRYRREGRRWYGQYDDLPPLPGDFKIPDHIGGENNTSGVEPWMDPEEFIKYHNDYFGKESDPTTQSNIRDMSSHSLHNYWQDLEKQRGKNPDQLREERQQSKDRAKGIADGLWNAIYPPEEEEGRKSVQGMDTVNKLMDNGWQPEHIKYDEDDQPYAHYQHPSGWSITDHGGMYKEIGHAATPDESHDAINVSRNVDGQSYNAPFGPADAHNFIEEQLHGDPEETGGTLQYLTQNHPAIRRYKPRQARRVALAPQDPAMAPQVPVGGGFQAGHRVGLDWRDSTVPGTVIANDGQVHIRWDDGQHTSEDPTEVRLL